MRLSEILLETGNAGNIRIEILSSRAGDLLKILRLLGFPVLNIKKLGNKMEEIIIQNKFSISHERLASQIRDRLNYNAELKIEDI